MKIDILSFIIELLNAVAWPVSVIIIVIILKEPLSRLIDSIQNLTIRIEETKTAKKGKTVKEEAKSQVHHTGEDTDRIRR